VLAVEGMVWTLGMSQQIESTIGNASGWPGGGSRGVRGPRGELCGPRYGTPTECPVNEEVECGVG